MGNAGYRQTTFGNNQTNQQDNIVSYMQLDLPKFVKQSQIGNGKFMKSYVMRVDSTQVVVKVYMKLPDEDLQAPIQQLTALSKAIPPSKYPNLLTYQMWIKSASRVKVPASPVYLLRQYFHSNLYDRLSTRPFLNELEKRWVIFQLFKCLEICHELGIVHGDLKPENIMCTTSNMIVLTDFSPFKPVLLPDDDPTDFQYYFDAMSRHRCYLAPERFYQGTGTVQAATNTNAAANSAGASTAAGDRSSTPLMNRLRGTPRPTANVNSNTQRAAAVPAMDVFSLGCIMAEVLLDGAVVLDLPSMLQYLSSGAESLLQTPVGDVIGRISDVHMRNVVLDMTQRDPAKRMGVSDYLGILQGKACVGTLGGVDVFPNYFELCLYPLYMKLHWNGITPDDRAHIICDAFDELMLSLTGVADTAGSAFFDLHMRSSSRLLYTAQSVDSFRSGTQSSVLLAPSVPTGLSLASSSPRQPSTSDLPLKENILMSARVSAVRGGPSVIGQNRPGETNAQLEDLLVQAQRYIDQVAEEVARMRDDNDYTFLAPETASVATSSEPLSRTRDAFQQVVLDRSTGLGLFRGDAYSGRHEGVVVVIDLLCSNYRHLKFLPSRTVCLLMLLRFGLRAPDSVITQRIMPMLLHALEDTACSVRVLALRIMTSLLARVSTGSGLGLGGVGELSSYFPSYVFPFLNKMVKDPEASVRMALAESIGSIAHTAKHFLDCAHILSNAAAGASVSSPPPPPPPPASSSAAPQGQGTLPNAQPLPPPHPVSNSGTTSPHPGAATAANNGNGVTSPAATPTPSATMGSSAGGNNSSNAFNYDLKLDLLKEQVGRWIRDLIIDTHTSTLSTSSLGASFGAHNKSKAQLVAESCVKKALLHSMLPLCTFFGQEAAMERVLTQALTSLTDQDWELRTLFCRKLPPVACFLGSTVTSAYILPCMENVVYDIEERVSLASVQCISEMVGLGLVSRELCLDFVKKIAPLTLAPVAALRKAAVSFLANAAKALGGVDSAVYLLPLVQSYLSYELSGEGLACAEKISASLRPPVSAEGLLAKMFLALTEQVRDTGTSLRLDLLPGDLLRQPIPAEEEERLAILREYIHEASREVLSKAIKWRMLTIGHASGHPSGLHVQAQLSKFNVTRNPLLAVIANDGFRYQSQQPKQPHEPSSGEGGGLDSEVYDSVLDHSTPGAANLSEHIANCVVVPGMKAACYVSEDVRKNNIYLSSSEQRNKACIRAVYLGTQTSYDIFRSEEETATLSSGAAAVVPPPLPLGINASITGHALITTSVASPTEPAAAGTAAEVRVKGGRRGYSFANMDSIGLLRRFRALHVPPLPVDMGSLLPSVDNSSTESTDNTQYYYSPDTSKTVAGSQWRPSQGVLFMTLREHAASVNRLVVSPDQSYFCSASSDCSVRVWQSRNLDRTAFPRSSAAYLGHRGAVLDAVYVEGTHSVASASKDGSVHVWRVDLAGPSSNAGAAAARSAESRNAENDMSSNGVPRVSGTSVIRTLSAEEGPVLAVQHYNTDTASLVCMATQRGGLHAWDLRMPELAFSLKLRPELGHATSMTVAPDRHWMCVGTSAGYLALWDVRYQTMASLWQHSSAMPLHRLACCKSLRSPGTGSGVAGLGSTEGAYVFVASNHSEAAVFGLPEGGDCFKCFRSLPLNDSKATLAPLPVLTPITVPVHPHSPVGVAHRAAPIVPGSVHDICAVRAMIGRISPSNPSYLITAGSDRHLRFWDFRAPENCYTIAGLEATQSKSLFVAPKVTLPSSSGVAEQGKLFVCYSSATPSPDKLLQSQLPIREGRGLVSPSVNFKDAVMDLKDVEVPMRMLLSASRDGEIKLWR